MLGCVLYEMCTLRRPFEGEALSQVVHKIIEVPFTPLEQRFDSIFSCIVVNAHSGLDHTVTGYVV